MTGFPAAHALREVARLVERHAGLSFAPGTEAELERGLSAAAGACCGGDVPLFLEGLLADPAPPHWQETLVEHLTIGETYFFREEETFRYLETRLLPVFRLSDRGAAPRRPTAWSAACSTGEEAYSLAALLAGSLPPAPPGQPAGFVLATDINQRSLAAARRGAYREWSFRGTRPEWRRNHFLPSDGPEWEILPRLRNMVDFHPYNLALGLPLPEPWSNAAFDILLCRNVLMYFSKPVVQAIVDRLTGRLSPDGVLVLGASEAALVDHPGLVPVDGDHCWIFHRGAQSRKKPSPRPKAFATGRAGSAVEASRPAKTASLPPETPPPPRPKPAPRDLYARGLYPEALAALDEAAGSGALPEEDRLLAARCLANLGRHDEALARVDGQRREDKLSPSRHFLRAGILEEMGRTGEAEDALQRCLFCDPAFLAAHFALGNLCRTAGRLPEARRHFENTLDLLGRLPPTGWIDEPGLEMTAGRLADFVREALRQLPSGPGRKGR